jgi:hypothetical protein
MIVIKPSEGAVCHGIAKVRWPLKHCDATRQGLLDAEVARLPGDLVIEFKQAACPASNGALSGA